MKDGSLRWSTFLISLLFLVGCHEGQDGLIISMQNDSTFSYTSKQFKGLLKLTQPTDSTWIVEHYSADTLADTWVLHDSVYRFECGDLTGDGEPEVLVGVIKPTRYRPEADKRLFIFKLFKGRYIRPLWLGSRVGLPLNDFKVERDSVPQMVHTWERDTDGTVLERFYKYQGFGLKYVGTK